MDRPMTGKERERIKATEYFKKRYAEDPEVRARKNATSSAWARENRELLNARTRERFKTDPEYRERRRVTNWTKNWRKLGYDSSIVDVFARMLKTQKGRCA